MDNKAASEWLTELESDPKRVQLHMTQLEEAIETCMDQIYELAKEGETVKKMQLVAIEHRARLLLDRWRKLERN